MEVLFSVDRQYALNIIGANANSVLGLLLQFYHNIFLLQRPQETCSTVVTDGGVSNPACFWFLHFMAFVWGVLEGVFGVGGDLLSICFAFFGTLCCGMADAFRASL